ncbi:MAG: allophanate hydrolase [Rheinheimera sp.]|uniref:5-oxoprolinase subunit C family protein n=1 Tax=Arsukibacterium sp. UBA3155 TaxID=1946058 RepID=UPI000C8B576A|nr:biotin-dependent carboxyltransferase family protein [Arsukibacterium sp. UBA3155]MAD74521.1 allophanate hydrolase [Rheinheimera sp.]|tara:strand:+ start:29352 stop:30416 length:1065 start_codon:yes stop_codon:yes gene_type:complete
MSHFEVDYFEVGYFEVLSPGVHSLIQDQGRFGQGALGLTNGGPLDASSAHWANALVGNGANALVGNSANALVGNNPNASLIECSIGGLQLKVHCSSNLCVTGASLALTINGKAKTLWQSHPVQAGDVIELGMVSQGLRAYLAVAGGFQIAPHFGSTATVVREGIGGLNQNGAKLQPGDKLPLRASAPLAPRQFANAMQPDFDFSKGLSLRLVEGYQQPLFSSVARQRFYLNHYTVTPKADRMGVKLSGPAIECTSQSLLSEGICYGAVQIPPDGQPIVLLNDRQTLGGYPKIGSVLSLDCWKLAQAPAGTVLSFEKIDPQQAHNALLLARAYDARLLAEINSRCSSAGADHDNT